VLFSGCLEEYGNQFYITSPHWRISAHLSHESCPKSKTSGKSVFQNRAKPQIFGIAHKLFGQTVELDWTGQTLVPAGFARIRRK